MASSQRLARRSRRADARIHRKNLAGIALTFFVVSLVAAGGVAFVMMKPPARDDLTGCLIARPPTSLTTVLIDSSDPLSPRQNADVRGHLNEVRDSIPAEGRVEVYALVEKTDSLLAPIITACNPGDVKTVNPWIASPKIAQDRWEKLFEEPFDRAVTESLRINPQKLSPIFEAIQSIAVTSLSRAEYRDVPRHLVVVSDFIENVPEMNQYRGLEPFDKFANSAYYRRIRSDLRGVQVDMFYIWRNTRLKIQGRAHAEFWSAFFIDQGARPTVTSVQG